MVKGSFTRSSVVETSVLILLVPATFGIGVVGSLAGLVLGNLRLPLLLSVLPAAIAGGTNVTVSGAGAGAGILTHLRGGRFDRQAFVIMAPPSVVGAIMGGFLAGLIPGFILVLIVSLIILEQGAELIRSSSRGVPPEAPTPPVRRGPRWIAAFAAVGFGIGVLGGLVGLILGTIRLPAMLRAGIAVRNAVATNLAVGFLVGIAGLLGHLAGGTVDLVLVAILVPPAVAGGILGARVGGGLSEHGLRLVIGIILVAVGATLLLFFGLTAR